MKAIVTNKKRDYNYVIENVVAVNYVETQILIISINSTDGNASTATYCSKEIIVTVA